MPTQIEKAQEIANRGLAGKLNPEQKARFDALVSDGAITLPSENSKIMQAQKIVDKGLTDKLNPEQQKRLQDMIDSKLVTLPEQPSTTEKITGGLKQGVKQFGQGITQQTGEGLIQRSKGGSGSQAGGFDAANPLGKPDVQADIIADSAERLNEFNQGVKEQRQEFNESPVGQTKVGQVSKFVGEVAPALTVPGGVKGKLIERIATAVPQAAVISSTQFTENRAQDVGVGTVATTSIPVLGATGKKLFQTVAPIFGRKTAGMIRHLGGDELLRATAKRWEAGQKLGLNLTPAESSGSAKLAQRQGKLGRTDEAVDLLASKGQKRLQAEREAITNFLYDLSPDGSSAASRIRSLANKIIKDENKALAAVARPLYKQAEKDLIPEQRLAELLDSDPVLKKAYTDVMKVPAFQKELADSPINGIKTLDIVKRYLRDQVDATTDNFGKVSNEGRIIQDSVKKLVAVGDEFSPSYKEARSIFSNEVGTSVSTKSSIVGRIANLKDTQLKSVSKILFDPSETDIGVLSKISKQFAKEDPKAWNRVIRNEIERRLDASTKDRSGSVFFDTVLRRDRDFRQFLVATRATPETRKALVNMRRAFKHLINPESVKGAAGKAKSSLDVPRSTAEFIVNSVTEIIGGKHDFAAVEIITNPQWQKELTKALAEKTANGKTELLVGLFARVAASEAEILSNN